MFPWVLLDDLCVTSVQFYYISLVAVCQGIFDKEV